MKIRITILALMLSFTFGRLFSQDEEKPGLNITGSVDTYYKYDFSGEPQIKTSFGSDHNSFSIGMVDLSLSQAVGKASFVGEVAFGPRANASAPGPVQNLYISYQLSDLLKITGGFMATFVGYELISPVGNFNYSTSYLFTYGPFQNGGLKADFHFSDRIMLMVGAFNRFDSYTNEGHSLGLGSQLHVVPVDGLDIYLNLATSDYSGEEYDLTATYQATEKLKIGLNAANRNLGSLLYEDAPGGGEFTGVAGYLNFNFSDPFGMGLRYEYFSDDKGNITGTTTKTTINAITLSGNIKAGPFRLIPEFRFDSASEDIFFDADDAATGSASQFLLAAIYAF